MNYEVVFPALSAVAVVVWGVIFIIHGGLREQVRSFESKAPDFRDESHYDESVKILGLIVSFKACRDALTTAFAMPLFGLVVPESGYRIVAVIGLVSYFILDARTVFVRRRGLMATPRALLFANLSNIAMRLLPFAAVVVDPTRYCIAVTSLMLLFFGYQLALKFTDRFR